MSDCTWIYIGHCLYVFSARFTFCYLCARKICRDNVADRWRLTALFRTQRDVNVFPKMLTLTLVNGKEDGEYYNWCLRGVVSDR